MAMAESFNSELNAHKRNAMWSMFLLTNYRNACRIDEGRMPARGDRCYRCHRTFHYSYSESKQWVVMQDGTASCKECMPPLEWLDHVVQTCETKKASTSSTSKENTDFSIESRWLVNLMDGDHTFYCTDH